MVVLTGVLFHNGRINFMGCMTIWKRRCYTSQFSCNLSPNVVAPLRDKLHATLTSVTLLRNTGKVRCSVARIVAKSRTDFYFSQRLQHQKSCQICSFQGMLYWAIFPATCIATKLRDKLQNRLPSVTAPLFDQQANSIESFWTWTRKHLLPGLYEVKWYNGRPFSYNEGFISNRESFMVGMPRLRQKRIQRGECIGNLSFYT